MIYTYTARTVAVTGHLLGDLGVFGPVKHLRPDQGVERLLVVAALVPRFESLQQDPLLCCYYYALSSLPCGGGLVRGEQNPPAILTATSGRLWACRAWSLGCRGEGCQASTRALVLAVASSCWLIPVSRAGPRHDM